MGANATFYAYFPSNKTMEELETLIEETFVEPLVFGENSRIEEAINEVDTRYVTIGYCDYSSYTMISEQEEAFKDFIKKCAIPNDIVKLYTSCENESEILYVSSSKRKEIEARIEALEDELRSIRHRLKVQRDKLKDLILEDE